MSLVKTPENHVQAQTVCDSQKLPCTFQASLNEIEIDELFTQYQKMNFIYPAKRKMLAPYLETVRNNWQAIYRKPEELLWVITNDASIRDFSTVCVWRYSQYGMQAQHLVSSGNPFLSLKMMLAAQYKAERMSGALVSGAQVSGAQVSGARVADVQTQEVRSGQNWFRPNNRYAYRVFASMFDRLGPERAFIRQFKYLHLKLDSIDLKANHPSNRGSYPGHFRIVEVAGRDQRLMDFIVAQCGRVFLKAEELDQDDLTLAELAKTYLKYGMIRSRKVYKVQDMRRGEVVGAAILNRAPTGLNFSFLENRLVYLLPASLAPGERQHIIELLNQKVKYAYLDFEPGVLPIVTDEHSAQSLIERGAVPFKDYVQTIWLRDGFTQWFEHIQSFLNKIESRGPSRTGSRGPSRTGSWGPGRTGGWSSDSSGGLSQTGDCGPSRTGDCGSGGSGGDSECSGASGVSGASGASGGDLETNMGGVTERQ